MKKHILIIFIGLLAISGMAASYLPAVGKFMALEHENGPGIFIVDTTSGRTWWTDQSHERWQFAGQPKVAAPGAVGTYVLIKNESGEGVFVINTATGQAAWTDGHNWKDLGMPMIP